MVQFNFAHRPPIDQNITRKELRLVTNLLPTKILTTKVHHYDIQFNLEKPGYTARIVFDQMLQEIQEKFGSKIYMVFDGKSFVVSNKKLEDDVYKFDYLHRRKEELVIEAKLCYKNTYDLSELGRTENHNPSYNFAQHLNCVNLILSDYQEKNFIVDKSRSYQSDKKDVLSELVSVYHGIVQTVKMTSLGLYNNLDISFLPIYEPLNLIDLVTKVVMPKKGGNRDSRRYCIDDLPSDPYIRKEIFNELDKIISRVKLVTNHLKDRKITFKADEISDKSADQIIFRHEEKDISVADYYKKKYIRLQYPNLPCVVRKRKGGENLYFPLEVINIESNQKYTKQLNDEEKSKLLRISTKNPIKRFDVLKEMIYSMKINDNKCMSNFNVAFDSNFLKCSGYVLDSPQLLFSGQRSVYANAGSWNIRNLKAASGVSINKWKVIYTSDARFERYEVKNGMERLIAAGSAFGLQFNRYYDIEIAYERNELQKMIQHAKYDLIIFILPINYTNDVYKKVKTYAEASNNSTTITQCLRNENFSKLFKPVFCANLVLKINAKLNGKNWTIGGRCYELYKAKPTMCIGADVSHPGVGDLERQSIAAVVASTDNSLANFKTCIRYQKRREEIIEDLKEMVLEHLEKYCNVNKVLPVRIFYYRDGVGESQFYEVYEKEIIAIKECCTEIQKNYSPEITFIIGQKRHSVRFKDEFTTRDSNDRNPGNVEPGTVIDFISHPIYYDFYLVSHQAIQGTAHPVRYQVILNESNFTRKDIYELTNGLCYIYPRATKAVSIVAPIYFAHLAAARGKVYQDTARNIDEIKLEKEELYNKLFYM